jgi:glycosyltransferase involved in cell wall biosynthesis
MMQHPRDPTVSAVILTLNEQKHLERCLKSLAGACREVIVVDSGSTDETERIAIAAGARFVVRPWVNYADQFNFGLSLVSDLSDWVLRIDADEFLQQGWYELFAQHVLRNPNVSGIAIKRLMTFRGKLMRFGLAQTWQLRFFRRARGFCEVRWMDEHIVVDGQVSNLKLRLTDDNRNDIRWWTQKHLGYADREAIDLLLQMKEVGRQSMSTQAYVKRFLKDRIYRRMPASLRATAFFLTRYVAACGFLDGRRGFQFHFLQGWWYRLYTDLRVQEIKATAARDQIEIEEAISRVTGLNVTHAK